MTAKTKPPKKHEHILTSMETVTTSTAHEPSATSSAVPFDENSEDIYLSKLLVVNKTVEPSIRNSAITLEEQSVKSRIGGGKKRRLEVLLKEAEKKRNRMEKLKAEHRSETLQNTGDLPEAISAGKKLQQELWNDALKTASGEKTISVSDSAKIRKALKKKEKSKLKSAERWTARIASVEETKAERIQKRTDNINNRNRKHSFTTQYTSTTGNTSKKPAPKIPPRAGFEGRTNTGKFLNNKRKNE